MDEQLYDKIGLTAIELNKLIDELKSCNAEKQKILETIESLKQNNELEKFEKELYEKLDSNIMRYKEVVYKTKKLKNSVDSENYT